MSKHVSERLYEFLTGSLDNSERTFVENHLAECFRCREDRVKVEEALRMLDSDSEEPANLPDNYWENYWKTLELQLKTAEHPSRIAELRKWFGRRRPFTVLSPRFAYGVVGFALGAVIMLAILSPYLGEKNPSAVVQEQPFQSPPVETASLSSATEELAQPLIQFFQKAKALLIAVRNLDESKETPKDLSAELETSRKLAAECRSLRRQVLDPREQQLLAELDVLLVQLSKVQNERDIPKLDLVREGIEKNNLVTRIRVHELAQEVRLLQVARR